MRALLILFVSGLCVLWGGEARAHAVLLETSPSDRSVIAESPSVIILRFNEIVQPIVVQIRDAVGQSIPANVTVVDHDVRVIPQGALPAAGYIVSYRVTSADSHPVAGSFLFAVGRAPADWADSKIDIATDSTWVWASVINRAIFLAASLIAIGGLIFPLIARGASPLKPIVIGMATLGMATAVAGIYLQGGLLLDATDASLWDDELWRVGLGSTRGVALLVAVCGLACVAGSFFLPRFRRSLVAPIGVILVIGSFALSGHAATAHPNWIAIPTLLLHVAVVAFWLGSLMPLLASLKQSRGERNETFRRFSEIAIFVVPQLVVAGVILAVLQIRDPEAVFATAYGWILMVKIALVAALFILAVCNRWILMPEMGEGSPGHVDRFRRTIWAELGFGFAILCVTSFLSQTVPPRALAEQAAAAIEAARDAGYTTLIVAGDRKALLMVTPARPGRNTIRVRVFDADDQPVDPLEAAIDFSNPATGIEPLHRALAPVADGYFEYAGPEIGVAGTWTIRIEALISDFEKATFETELSVK